MKNSDLTLAKLLTFQFSLAGLLMFFLLVNQSPSPGEGRGDERQNSNPPTELQRTNKTFHLIEIKRGGGGVSCTTQA